MFHVLSPFGGMAFLQGEFYTLCLATALADNTKAEISGGSCKGPKITCFEMVAACTQDLYGGHPT